MLIVKASRVFDSEAVAFLLHEITWIWVHQYAAWAESALHTTFIHTTPTLTNPIVHAMIRIQNQSPGQTTTPATTGIIRRSQQLNLSTNCWSIRTPRLS